MVHGGHRAGGAGGFGGCRHCRVGHVAVSRAPELCQGGLAHPGQSHVGVGDDDAAGGQGRRAFGGGAGGKAEGLRIVKIGGGVDDPADHRLLLGRDGDAPRRQLLRDDGKAGPLDVAGQMMLNSAQNSTPLRAVTPFSYGWRQQRISVE